MVDARSSSPPRSPPLAPSTASIVLAYVIVCVVWGSTFFGVRIALESFPPFRLAALRFVAAGVVLFVLARLRREPMPKPVEWGAAAITGTLLFVLGNALICVAERSISSGLASLLVATVPVWTTVMARLFGERVSKGEAAGVLLGIAGVAVLNAGGELRGSPGGALAALSAPVAWALGTVAMRRLPLPSGAMMRTATQMLTASALMMLVSLALGEREPAAPTLRSIVAIAYLSLFGSIIAFSAYMHLVKHTRPSVATSYAYVNPVLAVVLGVALAGEPMGPESCLGAAIILAAVVVVGRARTKPAPAGQANRARKAQTA